MRNDNPKNTVKIVSDGLGVAGGMTNMLSLASRCVPCVEADSGLYANFDVAEGVPCEYFKITHGSLQWLEQDGIPEAVLNRLCPLKDRKFCSAETFRQARDDAIGAEQLTTYRKSIERYAHVTGRAWGLTIDSTRFNSVGIGSFAQDIAQIHCYRLPCSMYRDPRRREILEGVDGVIVVADSQIERMEAHVEMLGERELHLRSYGNTLSSLPWVIQYNKRDVPNIVPVSRLEARLNRHDVPHVEAISVKGVGVLETLTHSYKCL